MALKMHSKYVDWDAERSYVAVAQRDTDANVKSAKKVVKVVLVAIALLGIMHFSAGCLPTDDNLIQKTVCWAGNNQPSIVCPSK